VNLLQRVNFLQRLFAVFFFNIFLLNTAFFNSDLLNSAEAQMVFRTPPSAFPTNTPVPTLTTVPMPVKTIKPRKSKTPRPVITAQAFTPYPTIPPDAVFTLEPTYAYPIPTPDYIQTPEVVQVLPYLECVYNMNDGTYLAYFGYDNLLSNTVYLPAGSINGGVNEIFPADISQTQITEFKPGRIRGAFYVRFNGEPFEWRVAFPGSEVRLIKVTTTSVACRPIEPLLDCVDPLDTGPEAVFGYQNQNSFVVTLPIGTANYFNPLPSDRAQPVEFYPGRVNNVFRTSFNGLTYLNWGVGSYYAKATTSAPFCLTELGCSTTSTADALYEADRLLAEMYNILLQYGSTASINQAEKVLALAKQQIQTLPANLVNCEDLKYCSRDDLYARNVKVISYTNQLYNLVLSVLRTGPRDTLAGRRDFYLANHCFDQIKQIVGDLPRFESECISNF
jgi:hypothetical protein